MPQRAFPFRPGRKGVRQASTSGFSQTASSHPAAARGPPGSGPGAGTAPPRSEPGPPVPPSLRDTRGSRRMQAKAQAPRTASASAALPRPIAGPAAYASRRGVRNRCPAPPPRPSAQVPRSRVTAGPASPGRAWDCRDASRRPPDPRRTARWRCPAGSRGPRRFPRRGPSASESASRSRSACPDPLAWLADVLGRIEDYAADPARRTPPLELGPRAEARWRRIEPAPAKAGTGCRPALHRQHHRAANLIPGYPAVPCGCIRCDSPLATDAPGRLAASSRIGNRTPQSERRPLLSWLR